MGLLKLTPVTLMVLPPATFLSAKLAVQLMSKSSPITRLSLVVTLAVVPASYTLFTPV